MQINAQEIMVSNNKFGVKAEKYNNKNQHNTTMQNIAPNTTIKSMDLMSRNNINFGMAKKVLKKVVAVAGAAGAAGADVIASAGLTERKERTQYNIEKNPVKSKILQKAGFTKDVISDFESKFTPFYGLVDEALNMVVELENEADKGTPITKEFIESIILKYSPNAMCSSACWQCWHIALRWNQGYKIYQAYGKPVPTVVIANAQSAGIKVPDEVMKTAYVKTGVFE